MSVSGVAYEVVETRETQKECGQRRITRGMLAHRIAATCTNSTATTPEALIALEFRDHPFHDPFHAGGLGQEVSSLLWDRVAGLPREGASACSFLPWPSQGGTAWGLHPIGAGLVESGVEVKLRLHDALECQRLRTSWVVLVWRGRPKDHAFRRCLTGADGGI